MFVSFFGGGGGGGGFGFGFGCGRAVQSALCAANALRWHTTLQKNAFLHAQRSSAAPSAPDVAPQAMQTLAGGLDAGASAFVASAFVASAFGASAFGASAFGGNCGHADCIVDSRPLDISTWKLCVIHGSGGRSTYF
jgi:hypothetical protein